MTVGIRLILWGLVVLTACSKAPVRVAQPAARQAPTNRIEVPDIVRQNLGVQFVVVERRRVAQTLRFPGHFELSPTARQELRTPLAGRITLLVRSLQEVKAGEVIYRVDSPSWRTLQRDLLEIATQTRVDEARLASMEPLIAAHRAHERSLREAVAMMDARRQTIEDTQSSLGGQARDLAAARAELAKVRAELAEVGEKDAEIAATLVEAGARVVAGHDRFGLALEAAAAVCGLTPAELLVEVADQDPMLPQWRRLSTIEVRAATDGVVDQLPVASGSWLEAGQLVVAVSDLRQVRFRARGLQSDLPRLRSGLAAAAIPAFATSAPSDRASGRFLLGADADPAQRTLELFLEPSVSVAWARPGVAGFLEVEVLSTADAVLAIPLASTLQDGLERVLFRRDPTNPDRVIRLQADLGIDDGRWVEVQSGLRDGDQVVLAGAYELMLASSGMATKGGHFHADGTFHEGEDK